MTLDQMLNSSAGQIALLVLALVATVIVHGLLWRPLKRWISQRDSLPWRMAAQLRRPTRLILLVLTLIAVVPILELPSRFERALEHFALAALLLTAGWTVMVLVNFLIERGLSRTSLEEEDFLSRSHATQLRVIQKVAQILIVLLTGGLVLSTFESVRSYGVSLFASAGVAGLAIGFAARPVLANLIAGIQIAMTQPIRLNDVVIVEGEWGWIEEIRATYIVVRIWDLRRLVVPLTYFIEKPFQNWTRDSSTIIGQVVWHLDWTAPVAEMRVKLDDFLRESELWDGGVSALQLIETTSDTIQLRGLMSARNAPRAWDLRCEIREKMVVWLQDNHPTALPRVRAEMLANTDEGKKGKFW
ncbi:mechanosensitive ion channel family protein [Palleronia sp.]|uniref:mechanosensitive ion channel family protein n=1 Tax=Palleronia sp. TaxID=1940284 RepID=UPI0035C80916